MEICSFSYGMENLFEQKGFREQIQPTWDFAFFQFLIVSLLKRQ